MANTNFDSNLEVSLVALHNGVDEYSISSIVKIVYNNRIRLHFQSHLEGYLEWQMSITMYVWHFART